MTDWTIDKKAGVATCAAWGGVFTASKSAEGGKWFVRWESNERQLIEDLDGETDFGPGPALTIDAHVHYLDAFGVTSIPVGDHALDALAKAVSFNGPRAIRQHLEKEFMDRLGDALLGEGPSVFIGPDPF